MYKQPTHVYYLFLLPDLNRPKRFIFLVPPSAFQFPFCTFRVSKGFPVLSLWFLIGVGGMTVRIFFFWLPAAVSLSPPSLSPVPLRLVVAESHRWQTDNYSTVCFRLPELPQHHPPARLAFLEQHHFAPPGSF